MTIGLHFDEAEHRYFLDGAELPSVTTVLKAAGVVDFTFCTEFARERGSQAHKAVHYALEGDLDRDTLHPMLVPYVNAAERFIADMAAQTVEVERRVVSRIYGYAGTLDWLGIINGKLTLVDWKTTSNPPDATALQTAAYAEALYEETKQRVQQRYAVSLTAQGEFVLHPYTDRNDINVFRGALAVANWMKGHAA